MARDLDKRLKESERLLKQGKTAAATRDLRVLAEESAGDPLALNRIGDFLARVGQKGEAVALFDRIAADFARAAFYPQAAAVLKKVLRLEPGHLGAVLLLGEVYVKQKVAGESRAILLQSADAYLRKRDLDSARQVYEKLVALDPKEPLHRVRLAETRLLAGDHQGGAADLIAAGEDLIAADRAAEAEKAFRRVTEVAPGRAEGHVGTARSLAAQDRSEEAVALLESLAEPIAGGPLATGELLVLYEQVGQGEKAAALLDGERGEAIDDEALTKMLRVLAQRGRGPQGWQRLDPLLDRWAARGRLDRVLGLLGKLARLEGQELPALERMHRVHRAARAPELAGTLENLVRAYWARSMHAQASSALEELRVVAPKSPLVAESLARRSVSDRPEAEGPAAPPLATPAPAARPGPSVPAPPSLALPATAADREFVARALAEADAFRKYDLFDKAMGQIDQVMARFPGHVEGHEIAVDLLRTRREREPLGRALAALAIARHAAGDLAGAIEAADEAQQHGALPASLRAQLERAGLADAPGNLPPEAAAPVVRTPPPPPPREGRIVSALPHEAVDDELPEIEIEFEGGPAPSLGAREGMISAPHADSRLGAAPADAIEEIAFFLEQGMRAEGLERLATLRKQGYSGDKIEELERRAALSGTPPAGPPIESSVIRLDIEELEGFSEALEAELGAAPVPEAPPSVEQKIDDVFAAFKEQVAAEVGSDDFRTHYDLGIAYKEMGLDDDAMHEFETATRSPERYREACSMLALCNKERGDLPEAIRWYRRALEDPLAGPDDLLGIRYDLAEALAASGATAAALQMYGLVLAADPNYRDVVERVTTLRSPRPS